MKKNILFWFVAFVSWLLWLPLAIFLLLAFLVKRISFINISSKLGFVKPLLSKKNFYEPAVMVHVASFGEFNTLAVFLKKFDQFAKANKKRKIPKKIIVTTINEDLQKHALANGLPEVDELFFLPIENPLALRKFINTYNIKCIILAELELWPLSLLALSAMELPLFLVNAALYQREADIYKVFNWLFRPTLKAFTKIFPATQRSYNNFISLGVPKEKLAMLGTFKIDIALANANKGSKQDTKNFSKLFSLPQNLKLAEKNFYKWVLNDALVSKKTITQGNSLKVINKKQRHIILFASMHIEEIKIIKSFLLSAKKKLLTLPANAGLSSQPLILVAPRYFTNANAKPWNAFLKKLEKNNFIVAKRSEPYKMPQNVNLVLLNSFGEMANFFPLAKVVVMGGAFAKKGGHNLLEPLVYGKKVITGSNLQHYLDVVENFAKYINVIFGNNRIIVRQLLTIVFKALKAEKVNENKIKSEINKEMKTMEGASKKVAQTIVSYFSQESPT